METIVITKRPHSSLDITILRRYPRCSDVYQITPTHSLDELSGGEAMRVCALSLLAVTSLRDNNSSCTGINAARVKQAWC